MFGRKKKTDKGSNEGDFTVGNPDLVNENGERDYFNELYKAYKNDYITQYLEAYRKFKDIDKAANMVEIEKGNVDKKD